MSFKQFLDMLRARRTLALSVLIVTVLTTLIVSLALPKQYTATTSLVIDVKSPDPIAGMMLQGMMMPGYMATQIDILNSDIVSKSVAKLLGFTKDATAIEGWKAESNGKGTIESYYAELLQNKLDITPSRESNVITINYTATDPKFAAAVANAFAKAYIDTSIELRVAPARQYGIFFEEQQNGLRASLEKAQSRLSTYQQEKGILVTDDRMMDDETSRLSQLTAQLASLQAQTADAAGRQKSGTSELSQEVMQSPIVQSIKTDITRAQSQLAQLSGNLGRNNPQVRQLVAQIDALRNQLKEEIGRISGGAAVANRTGAAKEAELNAEIEQQKKRVLELKSQRDELAVLVNDVDTARHAYEAVGQRMAQSNLEGQSQQTNALVLSPAIEPTRHSRPKVLLNVLVSIVLGTMLGIGAALVMEFTDRRIRSAEDLTTALLQPIPPMLAKLDSALPPVPSTSLRRSTYRMLARLRPKHKTVKAALDPVFVDSVVTKSILGSVHGAAVKSTLIPRSHSASAQPLGKDTGRSIGAILVDSGRLTQEDAESVLRLQRDQKLRFGDAAIQLGLVTKDDIQEILAQQYNYTYLMPGDGRVSEEVIAAFKPFSPVVEQLRDLRSQLTLRWFNTEAPQKTLAVVSAGRGEGRSFTAANLAVVLSQLGERTLLIDADLRNPRQHELFHLSNKLGLSTVLAGRVALNEVVIRIPGLVDLSVLPAGPIPPNPQELLNRPIFSALISAVADRFDVVIVDTSAGSESSDSKTVATRTRGAVVVARKDVSSAPQTQEMVSLLQHAGVAVVGTVLNNG
jgi:chain length determinant protein tyrosine kinase EpsG